MSAEAAGSTAGEGASSNGGSTSTAAAGGSATQASGAGSSSEDGGASDCSVPAPHTTAIFYGDLLITDDASLATARAYTEVTGSVRVATSFAGVVELPSLTKVGGDLAVESTIITSPASAIIESNVTRLRARSLTSVSGSLWIYLNFKLVELDLRSLTSAGNVFIDRNTTLQMVRFDAYPTELSFDAPLPECLAPAFPNVSLVGLPAGVVPCECAMQCGRLVAHCE
jgi:hypothetical protein